MNGYGVRWTLVTTGAATIHLGADWTTGTTRRTELAREPAGMTWSTVAPALSKEAWRARRRRRDASSLWFGGTSTMGAPNALGA